MTSNQSVVYSINVKDLQVVAEKELARKLTAKEIGLVEHKLGDFIDWHEAIAGAIRLAIPNS